MINKASTKSQVSVRSSLFSQKKHSTLTCRKKTTLLYQCDGEEGVGLFQGTIYHMNIERGEGRWTGEVRGHQRTIRFDLQLQRSIPSSIILWAGWVGGWVGVNCCREATVCSSKQKSSGRFTSPRSLWSVINSHHLTGSAGSDKGTVKYELSRNQRNAAEWPGQRQSAGRKLKTRSFNRAKGQQRWEDWGWIQMFPP